MFVRALLDFNSMKWNNKNSTTNIFRVSEGPDEITEREEQMSDGCPSLIFTDQLKQQIHGSKVA